MSQAVARVGMREWFATLSYILQDHRRWFLSCMLLGLLSNSFVNAANPLALKFLFDEGIIRGDFQLFVVLSFAIVGVFTFWRIGVYLYRMYVQRLKNEVAWKLSSRMLSKFYRIPYGEVIRRDRGYFLSRIYDEASTAAPLVVDVTLTLSNICISFVVSLVVVVSISWRASLMVFLAVPFVYFLSNRYSSRIKRESVEEQEQEARVRGVLERAVGSYKVARIFGLEDKASVKVNEQVGGYMTAFYQRFRTSTRYETLSGIFMSYVENIAIISAGYEILAGRMTFGGFMGFMSAFWAVIGAVRGGFNRIPELSRAAGMVERLQEFEGLQETLPGVHFGDRVQLQQVSFAFGGNPVFTNLNLEPALGERILVLGANGTGKSTLAHLLCGLLQPGSGSAATLPLERISAIIQPYDFIPGTVRDNVEHATAVSSPPQRILELAQCLGIVDSLDKNPSELSAGQRKRLEILMVLLKPADLYVLDEPLAGIDVESKNEIMQAVFETTHGKTLLVILHGDEQFHSRFDRVLDLTELSTSFYNEPR